MISIEVDGDNVIEADFIARAAALTPQVSALVKGTAQRLQSRIVANAGGRPGPRRVTSDYVRSWNTIFKFEYARAEADIGTNAPQGRRLEYGFTGQDALGRSYNQPPYPHVGPAVDTTTPEFERGLERVAGELT